MEPDLHQRVSTAISHLHTGRMLSRDAWCHMDLVIFFASRDKRPFWTPGRTPIHSPQWLGQYSATMGLPDLMCPSAAFNSIDHFTVLTPGIPPEMYQEAISVLDKALKGELLPTGWIKIEGSNETARPAPQVVAPALRTRRLAHLNPVLSLFSPPPKQPSARKSAAVAAVRVYSFRG